MTLAEAAADAPAVDVVMLPPAARWRLWGEQQILNFLGAGEDEQLLLRAAVTASPTGGAGTLLLTNRRLIFLDRRILYARALVIPSSAISDVQLAEAAEFPVGVRYIASGQPRDLVLRPHSSWRAALARALGGILKTFTNSERAWSGRIAQQLVDAIRQGTGRPVSSTRTLPADFSHFGLTRVLTIPGFGLLTIAAFTIVAATWGQYVAAQTEADNYSGIPVCGPAHDVDCRLVVQASILDHGTGRHRDGSPGGATWLRVGEPGYSTYADFADNLPDSLVTSESATVEWWRGKPMGLDWNGRTYDTTINPESSARHLSRVLGSVVAFAVLSGLATLSSILWMWRQTQLRWLWPPITQLYSEIPA